MAKHLKTKERKQNTIASISKKVLMLFVMLVLMGLAILQINSYGKYVVNKDIVLTVKTAEYYFSAQAQQTEYITKERYNSHN